jgi:hypothetical protein
MRIKKLREKSRSMRDNDDKDTTEFRFSNQLTTTTKSNITMTPETRTANTAYLTTTHLDHDDGS